MPKNIYSSQSTVVLPTTKHDQPKPPTVIPLHGLDLAPPIHTEIRHFFHAPKDSIHHVVNKLKASLTEALEIYFPVAGTVVVNKEGERWIATDPANIREGTPFIVEIKDFPFEHETEELSPRDGIFLPPGSATFAVKLSQFSCGTLIMAASIHHQVADLRGYLDFVETWSKFSRGEIIDFSNMPNDWQRTPMKYFDGLHTQTGVPEAPPGYAVLPNPSTDPPSFATSEITYWNFTTQDVEKLKNEFSPLTPDQWISSGDALASLCWGAITRARRDGGICRSTMSDSRNERLAMAADGRDRAPRGDMQGFYFGNFNLLISVSVLRDDLTLPTPEASSRVALAIRQAIRDQLNPKAIAHKISFYEAPENTKPPGRIIWFGDVVMTNWCRFDLAGPDLDFGWGKPFCATAGGDVFPPGYVRMLQDKNSGDISVMVTIEVPAAKYLKSDSLLRKYGTLI